MTTTRRLSAAPSGSQQSAGLMLETYEHFKRKHMTQNKEIIAKNSELSKANAELQRKNSVLRAENLKLVAERFSLECELMGAKDKIERLATRDKERDQHELELRKKVAAGAHSAAEVEELKLIRDTLLQTLASLQPLLSLASLQPPTGERQRTTSPYSMLHRADTESPSPAARTQEYTPSIAAPTPTPTSLAPIAESSSSASASSASSSRAPPAALSRPSNRRVSALAQQPDLSLISEGSLEADEQQFVDTAAPLLAGVEEESPQAAEELQQELLSSAHVTDSPPEIPTLSSSPTPAPSLESQESDRGAPKSVTQRRGRTSLSSSMRPSAQPRRRTLVSKTNGALPGPSSSRSAASRIQDDVEASLARLEQRSRELSSSLAGSSASQEREDTEREMARLRASAMRRAKRAQSELIVSTTDEESESEHEARGENARGQQTTEDATEDASEDNSEAEEAAVSRALVIPARESSRRARQQSAATSRQEMPSDDEQLVVVDEEADEVAAGAHAKEEDERKPDISVDSAGQPATEGRRARKSVNYALPKLNTKMRQPEGFVNPIKRSSTAGAASAPTSGVRRKSTYARKENETLGEPLPPLPALPSSASKALLSGAAAGRSSRATTPAASYAESSEEMEDSLPLTAVRRARGRTSRASASHLLIDED